MINIFLTKIVFFRKQFVQSIGTLYENIIGSIKFYFFHKKMLLFVRRMVK